MFPLMCKPTIPASVAGENFAAVALISVPAPCGNFFLQQHRVCNKVPHSFKINNHHQHNTNAKRLVFLPSLSPQAPSPGCHNLELPGGSSRWQGREDSETKSPRATWIRSKAAAMNTKQKGRWWYCDIPETGWKWLGSVRFDPNVP